MNEKHLEEARKLAQLPYGVTVNEDEATDGTALILVTNDELNGCMAQGLTMEEALTNLADARVDYIASLLEDGLEVPIPQLLTTVTSGGSDQFEESVAASPQESTDSQSRGVLFQPIS